MIFAGVGLRRSASADDILALIESALARAGLERGSLSGLATSEALSRLDAPRQAAERLGLTLIGFGREALRAGDVYTLTRSSWALNTHGVGSVAEAAALAAAGKGATLLSPRIAENGVTCALAQVVD